jgi:hypothetical protein
MESTALLLGFFPTQRFHGLVRDYPQPISVIIDVRPLDPYDVVRPFMPPVYTRILTDIYHALGAAINIPDRDPTTPEPGSASVIDTRISYRFRHTVLVVETIGADLVKQARQTLSDIDNDVIVMMIDLPLDDPHTPHATHELRDAGFVFAGLMPRFHHERDYLRLQFPLVDLDFDHITVHSDLSHQLKDLVERELNERPAISSLKGTASQERALQA